MEKNIDCPHCPTPCLTFSLLSGLSKKQKETLSRITELHSYEKDDFIFRAGDPANSLYLIRQGDIKLVNYDSEGREKIVAIFSKGELIWEGLFLHEVSFPFSAISVNESKVCRIPSSFVEGLLREGNGAAAMVEVLSKKLHDANERNMILSTSDPKAKVARLFVYRASQCNSNVLVMKLEDIAAYVSLRPETVSRKLSQLIKEGILKKTGQSTFLILDPNALLEVAES